MNSKLRSSAVKWAALGKGRSVSSVILLIFEQPGIKRNSILSFLFSYDRKDYRIKQPIVITGKEKKTTYGGRAIIL